MAVVLSAALSLFMIPSIWWFTPGPLTLPEFAVAVLLLMPQGMVVLLAPVASIGFGTKPWRVPTVFAVAPVLVLTMGMLAGWVLPASNQMYREYVFSRISGRPGELPRGLSEMSAPALIREATSGTPYHRRSAMGQLSSRAALVVAVPVYFIFGIAIRRRLSTVTRWGIGRFVAGASAVCAFTVSDYAVSVLRGVSPAIADLPGRGGLSIWLSSLVLCLVMGVLARTSNQTQEPGTSEPI
jgi:hypothetical protein